MASNGNRSRLDRFLAPYRITGGKGFRLKDHDPTDIHGLDSEHKDEATQMLARGVEWLSDAQAKLFAQNTWSVLLIFQAMDAAGKDGTIGHVMSGVNPQGCQVFSFKHPLAEELDHDFLWRYLKNLPERGRIGIFNRSWYEEVLIVRVHRAILEAQRLPPELVGKRIWQERLEDIASIERYLSRNGVRIVKFFLNVSRDEQKRRFLDRLDHPDKNWKFSVADVTERGFWDDYMSAYEQAIGATATEHSPWYVVPADNKWFTRLVVSTAIVHAMDQLDLAYPESGADRKREVATARRQLLRERK